MPTKKPLKDIFGKNLKTIREQKGLSLSELAELVEHEMGSIHRYEAGTRFPKPEIIEELAKALNVSEADFFNSKKETPTPANTAYELHLRQEIEYLRLTNRKLFDSMRANSKMLDDLQAVMNGPELLMGLVAKPYLTPEIVDFLSSLHNPTPELDSAARNVAKLLTAFLAAPPAVQLGARALLSQDLQTLKELEARGVQKKDLQLLEKLSVNLRLVSR